MGSEIISTAVGMLFVIAILGLTVLASSAMWRRALAADYASIGFKPIIAGYLCGLLGILTLSFILANATFSERLARTSIDPGSRWTTVPGWTGFLSTALALRALLPIGLILVPITAYLIRRKAFGLRAIALLALLCLIIETALLYYSGVNQWARLHPVPALWADAGSASKITFAVALPFLLAIWLSLKNVGKSVQQLR